MSLYYASKAMVRQWVEGRHYPGIYFVRHSGLASCIVPLGRKVLSVYGEKENT